MTQLNIPTADYPKIITQAYNLTAALANKGDVASYIPELATVNPNQFGVHITPMQGEPFGIGQYDTRFSVQSLIKVLAVSLALHRLGGKIWDRIGVEPSGTAFNSLVQLEADLGIPRNPFINSGAIVICDMLISILDNPRKDFLRIMRHLSDLPTLEYSDTISASEKLNGHRNVAICNFMKAYSNIHNDPEEVLDFYFDLCSFEMTCQELSKTYLFLANDGIRPRDAKEFLTPMQSKRINALMVSCGFYDESGEFAFKVGLPGKSGVGGGIIAVLPDHFSIAVWSPRLNDKGNSYKSMKFLEEFSSISGLSIF